MRTHRFWYRAGGAVIVAALGVTAGCGSSGSGSGPGSPAASRGPIASHPATPRPTATAPAPGPGSAAARAAEKVQGPAAVATAAQLAALRAQAAEIGRLSPEQQAGQRVIYSYNGLSAPPGLLSLIRHGDVGGVIFFSFNIVSQAQLRGVIAEMIAANAAPTNPARRYPLLLMTDQEGGQVRRLPWAGPGQSEAQIGASASPAAAAATAGAQAAAGLRAVGMNVNLAPVLDVYRQAGDFDDQFQRSYSMSQRIVSAAGAAYITAQQRGGVAATAKHFPGLGAAGRSQDTDNEPVSINLPAPVLRSVDEPPFRAAARAGVRLTMVSWATYPALGGRLRRPVAAGRPGRTARASRLRRRDDHRRTRRGRAARLRPAAEHHDAGRPRGHGRTAVHGDQAAAGRALRSRAEGRPGRRSTAADRFRGAARSAAAAARQPADLTPARPLWPGSLLIRCAADPHTS